MGVDSGGLAQLRRGVLEHCVLALLSGEERYGYDLVAELSQAGLVASEGTVYPLLSRLRRDDLVATTWRESSTGPPRRYYALTPAGRRALVELGGAWAEFRDAVDALLSTHEGDRP